MKMQLYNGDCLKVLKEIPNNSVDLVVTDPPYNISGTASNIELHGKGVNISEFGKWDYEFNPDIFLKEMHRILKKDGQIYIFSSDKLLGKYMDGFTKYGFHYRQLLVWWKDNLMPRIRQFLWRSGTEYILYAGREKTDKSTDYTFNWQGQNEMKNLITTHILNGKERTEHPTQKPLEIITKLIKVSSNEGDTILDPFLGSGTTMVAARDLRRSCIGIELEKKYCEIAKKRLNWGSSLNENIEWEFNHGK